MHDLLFLVDVVRKVVEVGPEAPEFEGAVGHGPDGVHLVAVHPLHPVRTHLHVHSGEVRLVDAASHAVRRLQDHEVGYPGIRQPLPS